MSDKEINKLHIETLYGALKWSPLGTKVLQALKEDSHKKANDLETKQKEQAENSEQQEKQKINRFTNKQQEIINQITKWLSDNNSSIPRLKDIADLRKVQERALSNDLTTIYEIYGFSGSNKFKRLCEEILKKMS